MDKEYWEAYYTEHRVPGEPSLFAEHVANQLDRVDAPISLIELGCGNGRDSVFFHRQNLDVTAVDQVQQQIDYLHDEYGGVDRLRFKCADFTDLGRDSEYDVVYSRFTLHSISRGEQANVLRWAYEQLREGGRLYIEVRGKGNELYERGEAVPGEPDAFVYEGHYRRFLDFGKLLEQLRGLGFEIASAEEAKGFAPYQDTDYVFVRVTARKPART